MVLIASVLIMAVAVTSYSREWGLYRAQRDGTWEAGTDLFVYTKARLRTRLGGIVIAMILSIALAAWEIVPPASPTTFVAYVAALGALVLLLVLAVVVDFVITIKTAAPHDLTRQDDRSRLS